MTVADHRERAEALDPLRSFCVSAPAGSGKTGLLVQRFLALLARVDSPEHVVAITFTRKAAAEMRARIVRALQETSNPERELADFERRTYELALAVVHMDSDRGWGLVANPSRLRIQTIDSFCGSLVRQMPVLSGSGGSVNTTDTAEALYREAVERFLHRELGRSDSRRSDLETMLLHVDNNWELMVSLLSGLLARREQWQPVLGGSGLRQDSLDLLRGTVDELIAARWGELKGRLGARLAVLQELLAYQAENRGTPEPDLVAGRERDNGIAVADLLITKTGDWRKQLTKREGFPPGKGRPTDMKNAALALIAELQADEEPVLPLLREMRRLPDFEAAQGEWDLLATITRLLPRLAAQLLLTFQGLEQVDHSQIAMAAIDALGDDDAPTDLALRLDYQIEHLLVDEFQDTSTLQFELIRRLTRGWLEHNQANDTAPRTLFLVGDAMQSIYGFRQANVGLFLEAREHGVGDLPLEPLDLRVNFRSRLGLVDWGNETFARLFPRRNDLSQGAVSFRDAIAGRDGGAAPEVALFAGEGAQASELVAICDRVQAALDDDTVETIAILGRSRPQLRPILKALRERGIDAAAQELDSLEQRQVVRDLFTFATALTERANRYAWLSLLRTPSIGLSNSDLLTAALHLPTAAHMLALEAGDLSTFDDLSPAGRERLEQLCGWLEWCVLHEGRLSLRVFVEEAWLRLGGAAALGTAAERADAEQFFQCLEVLERDGEAASSRTLRERLRKLFAAPGGSAAKVQVMTLHKAKGLEFDCVLIPALSGGTANQDQQLLQWDEFVLPSGDAGFLLGTRPATGADKDGTLYDYLQYRARERQQLEAVRLLYVGCTRASDQLWLSGSLRYDALKEEVRPPVSGSLLAYLWPAIVDTVQPTIVLEDSGPEPVSAGGAYRRLKALPVVDPVSNTASAPTPAHGAWPADNRNARAWGTALHRCMEALAYRSTLPATPDAALESLLDAALQEAGMDSTLCGAFSERGLDVITRALAEPWLRHKLSPERPDRRPELPLALTEDTEVVELVVDYCVLDEEAGVRWIIDYKSSEPADGQGAEEFLELEHARYQPQLERYARAVSALFPEPVRCALYFLTTGLRREWTPST